MGKVKPSMCRIMKANSPLVLLQGYAVAWCEQENFLSMVLLKYFAKEYKKEWLAEVDTVQGMSCDEEPLSNLLHYRWHSKGEKYIVYLISTSPVFNIHYFYNCRLPIYIYTY